MSVTTKKKRKSWFEINPVAKQYVSKSFEKWKRIKDHELAHDIVRLPRGFTCYYYSKKVPVEERLRWALIASLTRDKGSFEYEMLEIERGMFRIFKKVREFKSHP